MIISFAQDLSWTALQQHRKQFAYSSLDLSLVVQHFISCKQKKNFTGTSLNSCFTIYLLMARPRGATS